jgi:tight adherence protein C
MIWLISLAYVSAVGLLTGGVALRHDPRVMSRLAFGRESNGSQRPGALALLGRKVPNANVREKVTRLVAATGSGKQAVDRILGTKLLFGAAGVALGAAMWPNGLSTALLVATMLGTAGFALPNFLLGRRTAAERSGSSQAVPDLLDAVAVCVTAGLSPRLALERAGDVVRGPLARELDLARRDVSLGAHWRSALRALAERTQLPELGRLAITLDRSQRLGSSVADQLRRLARDVRAERRLQEEERARRAPVLMLFPLVLCILPAFVLAAVVPALLVAARDIG